MGNKVALALLVLATSLVVSACGGTQGGSASSQETGPKVTRVRNNGHTDPKKGCDAQGINSTQAGIGACTEGGVQYVVANYGGAVKLRTIGVAITGVSVAGGDSGHGRTAEPRRDAFLRVTLQIQNRDKVPHRFSFGQTMLGVGGDNYLEATEVERRVHQESLAAANGGREIGPGETLSGDVVFDITRADYEDLERVGRFFVWNFGERASATMSRRAGQVGQIRLYAAEQG